MFQFEHDSELGSFLYEDPTVQQSVSEVLHYLMSHEKERAQTDLPLETYRKSKFDEFLMGEITERLVNLSNGKCAFCEGHKPNLRAYRFRPIYNAEPRQADPLANECYLWLAWEWSNFFPICGDCFPNRRANVFPVSGVRARPSREDVEMWLAGVREGFSPSSAGYSPVALREESKRRFYAKMPNELLDKVIEEEKSRVQLYAPGQVPSFTRAFAIDQNAELIGLNSRARDTILHFNLNHENTLSPRRRVIEERLEDLRKFGPNAEFDFAKIEYGGAWFLRMRKLVEQMLVELGSRKSVSVNTIRKRVQELYKNDVWKGFDDFARRGFETGEVGWSAIAKQGGASTEYQSGLEQQAHRKTYSELQPRLKEVKIRNFKSLQCIDVRIKDVIREGTKDPRIDQELPKTPCLMMLGENATGKSTLLEAVTLAALSENERKSLRFETDLRAKTLILNPKYMGSPDDEVPKEARVELTFEDQNSARMTKLLQITGDDLSASGFEGREDILLFAYGAHRLFGDSKDARRDLQCNNVITLFRNDVMTTDPERWLIDVHDRDPSSLHVIAAALRQVIQLDGEFRDIEIVEDDEGERVCQINLKRSQNYDPDVTGDEEEDDDEAYVFPTPLQYVSSGYRAIIALICDVFKGLMERLNISAEMARDVPVLILIDEIEAHLHPRWKLEIVSGLRRALPRATFLLSSHDPLCVRGMLNGEVIVFNRFTYDEAGGVSFEKADDAPEPTHEVVELITEFPDFASLTIEQLLTSDLFQLISPNDRRMERKFSRISRLLSMGEDALHSAEDERLLAEFRETVTNALPVGMNEAERLVQEAVAEFLAHRRDCSNQERDAKREQAKQKIFDKLQQIAGRLDAERGVS